jgi:GalNAc-alpha-(1->4)-GalNAc-alpha-(1->3)-diNAcBac-PP-undecaprenol alpha-1,4-N-acetyl-D-galactosaminyltransferase
MIFNKLKILLGNFDSCKWMVELVLDEVKKEQNKLMARKILIINNGLAGGGIERASTSLANYFSTLGYEVTVLALYKSIPFFQLNKEIQFVEPNFDRNSLNKVFYTLRLIMYIRKFILKIKPDTILAFGEWTNPYVVIAKSGIEVPLFLSDRMNPLGKLPFLSEFFRKKLYKKATGIIAQSNFAKSILEKKTGSNNIKVIYNPVNVIEKVDCQKLNRIVTVGRLETVKGHEFLIKAFAMIENKNWELSIVGDGSQRQYLESLAKDLNVYERTFFHGHLVDFSKQLSEAKVFVLPSLKEGFPNALIEAMTLPLPCICTDFFQGNSEIIKNNENGVIVKPGNILELHNAIDSLINDEEKQRLLGNNALKIRDELKFEKVASIYLNFILNK